MNTQRKLKERALTNANVKQAGIDAANLMAAGEMACTIALVAVAAAITKDQVGIYREQICDRALDLGYSTASSIASRYKGALLYCMAHLDTDLSMFTVTELYTMSKQGSHTANAKGAGRKEVVQTPAIQLRHDLGELIKKFGKAKVRAAIAKL